MADDLSPEERAWNDLPGLTTPQPAVYVEGPQELRVTRAWALDVAKDALVTREAKGPLTAPSTTLPLVEDILLVAQWVMDGSMPERES